MMRSTMRKSRCLRATSVLVVVSLMVGYASAHTKFLCTSLNEKDGRAVKCNGDQSVGSSFTHVVPPQNNGGWNVNPACPRDHRFDQHPLSCLTNRIQRVCSGVPPPMDRIARVKPGQTVNVAWPTNTHATLLTMANITFFYEGRNAPRGGRAEPYFLDWLHQSNFIGSFQFNLPGVNNVKRNGITCQNYSPNDYWGKLGTEYDPGTTENRMCWGRLRIPADAPPGLNRILMYWWIEDGRGTPIHYFDCAYYWVRGKRSHSFRRSSASVAAATRNSKIFQYGQSRPITDASYYQGAPRSAGFPWRQAEVRGSPGMGPWTYPLPWPSNY